MRNYSYNEELKTLTTRVEVSINVEDIIDHYNQLIAYTTSTKSLKVLIDCSNVVFDIRPEEISLTQEALGSAVRKYKYIREAIMVSQPYTTVVASLFQHFDKIFNNYSFQIFYTEHAATDWLLTE